MDTASEHALDLFAGLCAIGSLADIDVEPLSNGPLLSAAVTGTAWAHKRRYDMEAWAGLRTGPPSTIMEANSFWLSINGETIGPDGAGAARIRDLVPEESLQHIAAAADQIMALLNASLMVFSFVQTERDLDDALDGLDQAADTRIAAEYELDALIAELDFTTNCCNTLLSRVTVAEATNVHLGFDVTAVTLDPNTGEESEIGVGWTDSPEGMVHEFRIGHRSCQAHEEDEVQGLLDSFSSDSKAHFLHAFDHLHQISDAVGRHAVAKAAEAIAAASTVANPLLLPDRHAITHREYSAAASSLNDLALKLSEEVHR